MSFTSSTSTLKVILRQDSGFSAVLGKLFEMVEFFGA